MGFVAQPRHAFACARGKGETGVTVTVTGLSRGCLILFLSLIQPFAKSHLFTEAKSIMAPCSVFMAPAAWVEFFGAKLKATISLKYVYLSNVRMCVCAYMCASKQSPKSSSGHQEDCVYAPSLIYVAISKIRIKEIKTLLSARHQNEA